MVFSTYEALFDPFDGLIVEDCCKSLDLVIFITSGKLSV